MMQERDFIVKTKDQLRLEIVVKVESKRMTRKDAQVLLKISERTLKRYLRAYREKGIGFLRHGNALRKPVNKTPDPIKQEVQSLGLSERE